MSAECSSTENIVSRFDSDGNKSVPDSADSEDKNTDKDREE